MEGVGETQGAADCGKTQEDSEFTVKPQRSTSAPFTKNARRERQRLGGKSWGGWGALVSPLIMRVAGCTSRWPKGDNCKGKLGGHRKVKLFPGQCCVLVVCVQCLLPERAWLREIRAGSTHGGAQIQ